MNSALQTLAVVGGIVLIVGGLALALVTGLDPVFGSLGLLAAAAGAVLVFKFRPEGSTQHEGPTGERSRQVPLTDSQKNRAQFKDKI